LPDQISAVSLEFPRVIQSGAQRDMHRRAQWFETELLFAAPLDADATVRHLHRNHRSIHGDVIGAIVAITPGAMRVAYRDHIRCNAQHVGQ
jgi:hypothetical protein